MAKEIYELDPSADTIIVLKNPGAPFAVWNDSIPATPVTPPPASSEIWGTWTAPVVNWPIHCDQGTRENGFGHPHLREKGKKSNCSKKYSRNISVPEEPDAAPMPASPGSDTAEDITADLNSLFGGGQSSDTTASAPGQSDEKPSSSHEPEELTMPDKEEEGGIHYRVSSRHLALASGFFKSSLEKDGWLESQPSAADGKYHLSAEDWDPKAFLILLQILHLRNRPIPRSLTLEMLAKIAILVDYYRCSEAVEVYSHMWIKTATVESPVPSIYGRNLMLWMCIAWVFKLPTEFRQATEITFIQATTPTIQDMCLPIPKLVIDAIEHKRYQAIEKLVSSLHGWLDEFHSSSYTCKQGSQYNLACSSMLLGALTKEMDRIRCWFPRPEVPFEELSFDELYNSVDALIAPTWCAATVGRAYSHACGFHNTVKQDAKEVKASLAGLDVWEFKDRGETER